MSYSEQRFHELCFVEELCPEISSSLNGKLVRVTGKLNSYNPVTSVAYISSPSAKSDSLEVNTQLLQPSPLIQGSLYQFLGELTCHSDKIVLQAKAVRNVDGLDMELFTEAVKLQRQFLRQRSQKYIIRNPSCSNLPVPRIKQHNLKQVTIHSLKGVVVIEDLLRHKAILELKGQKEELLLESLVKLNEKKPCKEALVSSKIDQTLHDLYHHTNVKVSKGARRLMHKWNNHISTKTNRPTLEVRYDLKTQHFRKTALKWLTNAFGGDDEDKKLCDLMEKEVFYLSGRLVNNSYKRTMRKIVLTLQHSDEKKNSLRNGEVSPTIFAVEHRR